ncbi:hypothetical protein [Treponema sp.]|uniref:hypothetical protein n=1 Tax=Treponema sp. TaxID=166 RepID=UPI00298EA85C|nr:hypothetical protein [Treponema sp.]MCR5612401.1 hypothetical protein [Treponema sp.]
MKLRHIFLIVLSVFVMSNLSAMKRSSMPPALEYIVEKSSHMDIYFEDGKWIDEESICIKNDSSKQIIFKLSADFPEDFNNGYVKEKILKGYLLKDGGRDVFSIAPGKTIIFTVYFIGTSTDKKMKSNRKSVAKSNLFITTIPWLPEKDKAVQKSLIKLYPDYFYEHDAFEYIGKIKGDSGVFEFYQNVHVSGKSASGIKATSRIAVLLNGDVAGLYSGIQSNAHIDGNYLWFDFDEKRGNKIYFLNVPPERVYLDGEFYYFEKNTIHETKEYEKHIHQADYSRSDLIKIASTGYDDLTISEWKIEPEIISKQKYFTEQELKKYIKENNLQKIADDFINNAYQWMWRDRLSLYSVQLVKIYSDNSNKKRNDWIIRFEYKEDMNSENIPEVVFMLPDGTIIISNINFENVNGCIDYSSEK